MKNIIMIGFILLAAHVTFAQSVMKNDPQYSIHNYKHPNKAQYALEHNMGNPTILKQSQVSANDNYKQSASKSNNVQRTYIAAKPRPKNNVSYKHPYGF